MQTVVGEVMTTAVARVRPETPVTQVARLLRERGVTAVPVVDEEDHVLGVVSAMDLAMDDGQSYSGPALLGCMARHPARASGAKTAAERMSSPAVSVTPDVSLRTATRLLQMHGIHHLPVVGVIAVDSELAWEIDDTTTGSRPRDVARRAGRQVAR